MLEIKKTNSEIKTMKKKQLKMFVKNQAKETSLKYLQREIERKKLSKMTNLRYTKLEPRPYLINPQMTKKQASLLFALRTRTVRGIRADFGNMFGSQNCPLDGCSHMDTLPGLLDCEGLRSRAGSLLENTKVQDMDVFSSSLEQQREVVIIFAKLLNLRDEILSPPVA